MLLEPAAIDPLPGQVKLTPPSVIVNGEFEDVVEEILDAKPRGSKPFLAKYLGDSIPTWEPYEFVRDLEALNKFYARYPSKHYLHSELRSVKG